AGLAFLPVTAGIVIGAVLAQTLIPRLGIRQVSVVGISLGAVGLFLLSLISTHGTYLGDLLPGLAVMSVGMGLTFVPVTLIATTNIVDEDAGLASGLFNTAQQVGGALGLAILSTFAASRTDHVLGSLGHASGPQHDAALVDGFQLAFQVGAGLMIGAAILIVALIRRADVAQISAEVATA
ncbi:MAG: MFS transporter, partial [Gaiellaceae bacterium]